MPPSVLTVVKGERRGSAWPMIGKRRYDSTCDMARNVDNDIQDNVDPIRPSDRRLRPLCTVAKGISNPWPEPNEVRS